MKRSGGLHKSFRQRYFVLYQGRRLVNYDDDTCSRIQGEMDLYKVSSISHKETKDNAKYPHVFEIATSSTTWTLVCGICEIANVHHVMYAHCIRSEFVMRINNEN